MSISKPSTRSNLGGLEKVFYCNVKGILRIIDNNLSDNIVDEIVFKPGEGWSYFYVSKYTALFEEPEERTGAGTIFTPVLKFVKAQQTEADGAEFEIMQGERFLTAFKDNNGRWKLQGFLDEVNPELSGVKFNAGLVIPNDVAGLNKHEITFAGKFPNRSRFMQAADVEYFEDLFDDFFN